MTRLAAIALTLAISGAHAEPMPRCDSPGMARALVSDVFNSNPSAMKLGLIAERVELLRVDESTRPVTCRITVTTNRGSVFKYDFKLDDSGTVSLDLAP